MLLYNHNFTKRSHGKNSSK